MFQQQIKQCNRNKQSCNLRHNSGVKTIYRFLPITWCCSLPDGQPGILRIFRRHHLDDTERSSTDLLLQRTECPSDMTSPLNPGPKFGKSMLYHLDTTPSMDHWFKNHSFERESQTAYIQYFHFTRQNYYTEIDQSSQLTYLLLDEKGSLDGAVICPWGLRNDQLGHIMFTLALQYFSGLICLLAITAQQILTMRSNVVPVNTSILSAEEKYRIVALRIRNVTKIGQI